MKLSPDRNEDNGASRLRVRVAIRGAVQGVGFRPFVYRLAQDLGLLGWVNNSAQGVRIEVEGSQAQIESFLQRLQVEQPPQAFIQSLEPTYLDVAGYQDFQIRESDPTGAKTAAILPDLATCADCVSETFDLTNRRYRYPFTNCTNCGPRFSIIEALPYDRPHTTMKRFVLCDECRAEYDNPLDRRFHAQPNACPRCGPHLELWDRGGTVLYSHDAVLRQAAAAILQGQIVAVKGLGGFHLMVDARNSQAVTRLRRCKLREAKPLAVMYPSLAMIREDCVTAATEERLLQSTESPIVLLRRRPEANVCHEVAPQNPYLGVMLPYTPLHHLLLREIAGPVVATSGNQTDEPICIDEHEALERLGEIADLFLVHNRPIARYVDDSIVRVVRGREMVLRRARGYAPLPIRLAAIDSQEPCLAVGAHLKNTIALAVGQEVFCSQHIGDLETPQALDAFRCVIEDFERLYEVQPTRVACDAHPDYLSTRYARQMALPVVQVQHHYAHMLSCMAENELEGPALGVAWDGTGYGLDGTIWGGEFLRVENANARDQPFARFAHFRNFALPGGEAAIREPRRAALGILYELFGSSLFEMEDLKPLSAFSFAERGIVHSMLRQRINAPLSCSVGRLFDAVAALCGIRQMSRFEGQAAMELEFAIGDLVTNESYCTELWAPDKEAANASLVLDWAPLIGGVLGDLKHRVSVGTIAAKFHNALAECVLNVAYRAGERRVVLTGGCFQNYYLLCHTIARLENEGFKPYWHQRIPTNDGGIALGQIVAASRERVRPRESAVFK